MKNIFGLNKYAKKEEAHFDGSCFISRSAEEKEEKKEKKLPSVIPVYMTVIQYAGLILVCVMIIMFMRSDIPFKYILKEAVHVPVLVIIGTLLYFGIGIYEGKKRDKMIANGELFDESAIEEPDEEEESAAEAKAKESLGIPEDATDIDVLGVIYRNVGDETENASNFDFLTIEMFAFSDGETLNIADYNDVYSIAFESIKSIERIDKKVTALGWSKEEDIDSEAYAQFELAEDEQGLIVLPYYYSVRVATEEEEFELALPPYEAATFSKLTGKEL